MLYGSSKARQEHSAGEDAEALDSSKPVDDVRWSGCACEVNSKHGRPRDVVGVVKHGHDESADERSGEPASLVCGK